MQLKKYYKDIVSLMATLSLLATVLFINKYDVKQLYREFATLRLKVDIQEKVIANLEDRVYNYSKQYRELQIELEEHNKTRGIENADLYERLRELEREILVLSDMVANRKTDTVFSAGSDVREFVDRQENRLGFYETQGTALLGWKDDYLTTSQFKLNTVGNLTLQPKIKKSIKMNFIHILMKQVLVE